MATELTMPQMGYDMREGTVVRWLKEEGSQVDDGEPIAEIETDKAVVEFESYAAGILHYIVVPEGTTVPVGQAIAVVGEADEDVPKPAFEAATPTPPATSPRPTTPPMPAEPRDDGPAPRSDVVREGLRVPHEEPAVEGLAEHVGLVHEGRQVAGEEGGAVGAAPSGGRGAHREDSWVGDWAGRWPQSAMRSWMVGCQCSSMRTPPQPSSSWKPEGVVA